jgi:hypothetical protein
MTRLLSHALSVLSLLTITSGCAIASAADYQGSMWLGVAPVQEGRGFWLELRTSAGATLLNPGNGFQADAVILSHDYYRLSREEAGAFAANLAAWATTPHSNSVYSHGQGIRLSVIGNASTPLAPVVVLNIQVWVYDGRGHAHGGNYLALTVEEAAALAQAIAAWVETPTSEGFIYELQK